MSESFRKWYTVRPRFWPLLLRWAVIVHGLLTPCIGFYLILRPIQMAGFGCVEQVVVIGGLYALGSGLACALAARHWQFILVRLNENGLRQSGTFIPWDRFRLVRQRYSWLNGRVLHIQSVLGGVITLPERPADFDGFREAVERFAGELHPLARALAEIAEEG